MGTFAVHRHTWFQSLAINIIKMNECQSMIWLPYWIYEYLRTLKKNLVPECKIVNYEVSDKPCVYQVDVERNALDWCIQRTKKNFT